MIQRYYSFQFNPPTVLFHHLYKDDKKIEEKENFQEDNYTKIDRIVVYIILKKLKQEHNKDKQRAKQYLLHLELFTV